MERVKERYQIRGRVVLYAGNIKPHKNLDRLIAAFGLLKQTSRARGPEAADHRRRDRQVPVAAAPRRGRGRAPGRALLRVRARADAGRALSPGLRVRVPVALRGLRAAAAGGHGLRHAGRDVEHVVDPRGRGRRRGAGRSLRHVGHRGRPGARAGRPAAARHAGGAGPRARRSTSAGSARCAPSTPATCGSWASPRADRRGRAARPEGRARPRLADGDARRREGAALAGAPLPRRADLHAPPRARDRSHPELEAREIHTTFVQRLPGRGHALPPLPAALPRRGRGAATCAASTS